MKIPVEFGPCKSWNTRDGDWPQTNKTNRIFSVAEKSCKAQGRDDNLWRPGRKVHLTLANLMFAEVWSLFAVFFQSSILSMASFCKPKTSIWRVHSKQASVRTLLLLLQTLGSLVVSKKVSDIGVPRFSWYKWWNICSRRWCLFTVWSKWFQGVRVRVRYWKSGTPTVDG